MKLTRGPLVETLVDSFQGSALGADRSASVRFCVLQPRDLERLFINELPEPQPVRVVGVDKQQLRSDDVLVSLRGQPMRAALFRPHTPQPTLVGNTLAVLRPKPSLVDPVFLAGLLASGLLHSQLRPFYATTSSGLSLSLKELRRVTLPLPNLETQQAIAEVFAASSAYEESVANLLTYRRRLVTATLAEVLEA